LNGSGLRLIPGLDSNYYLTGWSPDGGSLYAVSRRMSEKTAKVFKVNIATGKMEPWKTFGAEAGAGVSQVGGPHFSRDGNAYAYIYDRVLSEAYVVTGLR
jgi:hypothetical protein